MKKLLFVLIFTPILLIGCTESSSSYSSYSNSYNGDVGVESLIDSCCKHCSTGKACGDSCISMSYTCHKPAGCACDY